MIMFDRDTLVIIVIVGCGALVPLLGSLLNHMSGPDQQESTTARPSEKKTLSQENVPLATGDEPVEKLFTQAGCPVCHTIPGIPGAKGRQGPVLILGSTARQRLADANYRGEATTEREYILESVLNPGAYIVPGYPDRVMPRWYGQKLSAKALDKIVNYLERIMSSA